MEDHRSHVYDRMDLGECGGAIGFENDLFAQQADGNQCDKMIVGSHVLTVNTGMPVASSGTGAALKLAFEELLESGEYAAKLKAYTPSPQYAPPARVNTPRVVYSPRLAPAPAPARPVLFAAHSPNFTDVCTAGAGAEPQATMTASRSHSTK